MTDILANLLDATPVPQVLIGDDDRILAANRLARQIVGEGIVGRHFVAALRHPALLDCVEAVRRGPPGSAEAELVTTGRTRDTVFRVVGAVAEIGGGRAVLLSLIDVTDMQAEGAIRRDFVANVSHELKTPLTALMGFIETLRGAARDDPEAQARFLEIMEREAGRMNRLVSDLLSLSRVESEERVRRTRFALFVF